ncbi:RNA polymerase sigma-70 factor (ECF subfamily) [Dysgonomonas sp. PH5-45]|uniref:RNA polymerase sigma factor n=1 Tax=unclassified Dysgonomonas TaxID=2630389 RepID=UPI002472FF44|nr:MULTISPECIES: sigma-70 family RNA polymerase sigma factor [unclassified Dysgonomonas]MDH6356094.1 RNA polymerase sigma-70 factor (ECF subfamily) [Dysgonomonas sp. PH5-45]MDH6388988.1 RNA polymerase sigma-70 factor (ECF subfamily) [Dysgonomonas sp. PH5-37]
MSAFDEKALIAELKNTDTQKIAFARLVKEYSEKLYWQIRKIVLVHDDANDVLQNTFIKAWTNIDGFRGDSKLQTWLYKIAINEAISFINKQRQHTDIPLDDADNYMINRLESDSFFDGDAAQVKLQKAILQLPEKQRIVFNMKYFDEMKYEEMSEVLDTSVGALKASYHHAVKKIEDFLSRPD